MHQGQRVLIHAGAGGVGSFAVQLAKARGAHVITTAGPRNTDFVQKVAPYSAMRLPADAFIGLRWHLQVAVCVQQSTSPVLSRDTVYSLLFLVWDPAGVSGTVCSPEALNLSSCEGQHSYAPLNEGYIANNIWTLLGRSVQELGADEAIDYTASRFDEVLKSHPVDVVIDPMAGAATCKP